MPKYRVELDRINCVASVGCIEEDPKNWTLDENENKVDLKESQQKKPGLFTREIEEVDLPRFIKAAKACPVNVIHIFDESGKMII